MSIYDRQKNMNINRDLKICIIGCGGVGMNAAIFFCMSGIKKFILFDNDFIEEHNLNRLPAPYKCIGMNKAKVTMEMIYQMRPEVDVDCYKRKFNVDFLKNNYMSENGDINWIVDCTDNFGAQKEISKFAEECSIKYCKLGYNGERISINDKVATWDIDESDQEGYTITPSWAVPTVMVACMGVAKVMKYEDKELATEIKNMYIK